MPETIPQRVLERNLIINGNVLFTQYKNDYYVFTGGLGGFPNENYEPTLYTFANPYLKLNGQYRILNTTEKNYVEQFNTGSGVLIRNDSCMLGLMPLFDKYNSLLTEIDITIYRAVINIREQAIATAGSEREKQAIIKWYEMLEKGEPTAIIDKSFEQQYNGIKIQPLAQSTGDKFLSQLIEMRQYIMSTLNNKVGINCNFNMKREALSTAECALNDQSIIPLILDMFACRLLACEYINKYYGLNVSVKLNNLWRENVENITEETDEKSSSKQNKEQTESGENNEI